MVRFKLIFILLVLPLSLKAQQEYIDFILLKNEKILSCRIEKMYSNTVVFNQQNMNRSAALFAVRSIQIQGMGLVFYEEQGLLYNLDSINIFLAQRNGTPLEEMPVFGIESSPIKKLKADKGFSNHELSVAIGVLTIPQFAEIFSDLLIVLGTLGNVSTETYDENQLQMSYRYFPDQQYWAFGIDFAFEQFKSHLLADDENIANITTTYVSIAAATSYYWLRTDILQFYSGVGLGITIIDADRSSIVRVKNPILPTIQLNLLGFKIGQELYLLGEIGGGYRGLFTLGLAYQF